MVSGKLGPRGLSLSVSRNLLEVFRFFSVEVLTESNDFMVFELVEKIFCPTGSMKPIPLFMSRIPERELLLMGRKRWSLNDEKHVPISLGLRPLLRGSVYSLLLRGSVSGLLLRGLSLRGSSPASCFAVRSPVSFFMVRSLRGSVSGFS
jgi:hypothetical protein